MTFFSFFKSRHNLRNFYFILPGYLLVASLILLLQLSSHNCHAKSQSDESDGHYDLELYKARLLAEMKARHADQDSQYIDEIHPEDGAVDYLEDYSGQEGEDVVGTSFATTQSSAISFSAEPPTQSSNMVSL